MPSYSRAFHRQSEHATTNESVFVFFWVVFFFSKKGSAVPRFNSGWGWGATWKKRGDAVWRAFHGTRWGEQVNANVIYQVWRNTRVPGW